jgi:hypothetical protein
MNLKAIMGLCLLSCSVSLSGCTTITKYEPLIYTIEIPAALRTCSGLPKRPTGVYTEREVGEFIAKLNDARLNCKLKLKELTALIDKQNANALKLKEEWGQK